MRHRWQHTILLCTLGPAKPIVLAQTLNVPRVPPVVAAPAPVPTLAPSAAPGVAPVPTPVSVTPTTTPLSAPASADNASAPESYQLQTGDTFTLRYRLTPEYNQSASVQPDGTVTLQLLGPVQVRDLTVAQARARIQEAAARRLRDPELALELTGWEGPHFTVLGQVGLPGRFALRGPLTVEDGLAMAGGLQLSARHNNIVLIHRVSNTVGATQLIDYKSLEQKHKPGTELFALQPGDILYVPMDKLTKVERYVRLINFGIGTSLPDL